MNKLGLAIIQSQKQEGRVSAPLQNVNFELEVNAKDILKIVAKYM